MAKSKTIHVLEPAITVVEAEQTDYISLTDIARYKDANHTDAIIQNWLRNRNTIESLGFWESMYNPNFKPVEFEGFRKQAGLNSFVLTPKRWIETTNAIALFLNLAPMVEPLLIEISLSSLHPGFQLNSNCTSSKNSNASKKKKTTACN